MTEYASNSYKSKEEPAMQEKKPVEKVTTGEVKVKKPTFFNKLVSTFIAEDSKTVKEYLVTDVVVPAVKKAVSDLVTNGIDMLLYGSSGNPAKKQPASKVSYKSYYSTAKTSGTVSGIQPRRSLDFDNVIVETRGEAEDIIDRLQELIDMYGLVSVSDFYDLCGITNGSYTDNNYGWTSISSAQIVRTREGFLIKMPRCLPLDR